MSFVSPSRFFKKFFFILLVVVSPLTSFGSVTDPSLKWKTIETKHFAIHFYEGEEEIAQKLVRISEEVYDLLSKKFDARPWGKTEVVLMDNHDAANAFTLVIPYNLIVLRVVPPFADNTLADYDQWLRELFVHEYTHVIHLTDTRYPAKLLKFLFGKLVAPNGLTPGWVIEGIATYFETVETTRGRGRASFTNMLLRTDILQDKFLHLDQMAGSQYSWPSWLTQYLYGVAFWQFLAEQYGEEKIIEFSHKYGASLRFFMLNSQAKRVFHKNFYRLWKEWKESLQDHYQLVKEELEKQGLQEGEVLLQLKEGETLSQPLFSPNGKKITYIANSVHHPAELRLRDLETGEERTLLKKREVQQLSFSPDGERVVVSNISYHKKFYQFSDLHEITLESGEVKQLTKGKRARDPDYSPDGKKIVAVLQETGTSKLGIYDREAEQWEVIEWAPDSSEVQWDHPRWLPEGRSIVASVHAEGQRDLWIVGLDGKKKRITSDIAIEDRPAVDPKRKVIYFSSDRDGIPNLYRYDLRKGKLAKVTNVLTGAFAPSVDPQGDVAFQYYNGKGFEIRRIALDGLSLIFTGDGSCRSLLPRQCSSSFKKVRTALWRGAPSGRTTRPQLSTIENNPYNPFKRLFVPRYVLPNAALIDGAVFLSATISNFDPLYRHQWFGDVTFRSDNQFVGFDVGYTYNRWLLPISVGFSDFTVNYGDVFGFGTDFFEERRRAYSGIAIPLYPHRLSFSYFFEDRSEHSGLPAGAVLQTLGRYSGLFAQYSFSRTNGTAARISPEGGGRFNLNFEITDRFLGGSEQLEQQVVWGDARKYLKIPFTDHHVLALRAAGGVAFGDQLLQGNFGLGGAVGESPFSGTSTRLFTLRGLPVVTFSRDRVWVASAEYRMPLFRLQRGLGTLPFALNSAHFALFADVGDAFNRGNPSFRPLLGIGVELRGDFILAWHLSITGRIGYGIILTNRNRIAGVTDSLTGMDARNGVVVLEVGTSF